ncbi:MAG: hypothetical protein ABS75_32275 [Pelagibacterium sp. SCN 63-23]|nr:MAG: hypothetical protein ABS75_32275 [Pelagibacterium sp. SCN 63-23]
MHDKLKLTSTVLDSAGIKALNAEEWDRLCVNALAQNPFYARQYVLAGLETLDRAAGVHALAIRDGQETLVGLFPFRRRLVPPCLRLAQGAENLYQFSGIPLVARDGAQAIVGAWLAAMVKGSVPCFWTMANMPGDGPLRSMIDTAAAKHGFATHLVTPYSRPHLTGRLADLDTHASQAIAKARFKDIQRNLRRLRDMGELAFERTREPSQVRRRLEEFLAMEQAGWKGAQGTAFRSDALHEDFAQRAFGGDGLAVIDSLLLDGKPIAISINIAKGDTAFTPKCAYDETLRKFGPGMVLEYLVIDRFYGNREFADMDAATTTGGHVVLGLWDGQKQMGRLIIGPGGWRTDALARGWQAAFDGKQRLKKWLKR